MIPIVNAYLLKPGFAGFACWPFVFMRDGKYLRNRVFLNHESIHLRQQKELLVIPFYILYVIEYFIRFCYYGNSYKAYKNISFEREAYYYENQLDYLKTRKIWSFIRFL